MIGYRDEALAETRGRAGSGAKLMPLSRYVEAAGRPHASGPKINWTGAPCQSTLLR